MKCSVCSGTFISWDNYQMLQQLTVDVRSRFPALLTREYGCDMAVVGLLRARTLGNTGSSMANGTVLMLRVLMLWERYLEPKHHSAYDG